MAWTIFFCPYLHSRSSPCFTVAGFQSVSKKSTTDALVRVMPVPAALSPPMKIFFRPAWNSWTIGILSLTGVSPYITHDWSP